MWSEGLECSELIPFVLSLETATAEPSVSSLKEALISVMLMEGFALSWNSSVPRKGFPTRVPSPFSCSFHPSDLPRTNVFAWKEMYVGEMGLRSLCRVPTKCEATCEQENPGLCLLWVLLSPCGCSLGEVCGLPDTHTGSHLAGLHTASLQTAGDTLMSSILPPGTPWPASRIPSDWAAFPYSEVPRLGHKSASYFPRKAWHASLQRMDFIFCLKK